MRVFDPVITVDNVSDVPVGHLHRYELADK